MVTQRVVGRMRFEERRQAAQEAAVEPRSFDAGRAVTRRPCEDDTRVTGMDRGILKNDLQRLSTLVALQLLQ